MWIVLLEDIISCVLLLSETIQFVACTAIDNENDKQPKAEKEIDEKEVWALRAQALKSLACKRASKVKMAKKVRILYTFHF